MLNGGGLEKCIKCRTAQDVISLILHIQSGPSMLVFLIKFLMHFAEILSPRGSLRGPW